MARCSVIAAACAGCSLQDFEGLGAGITGVGGTTSDDADSGVGGTDPGVGGGDGTGGTGGSDGNGGTAGTEGPETGAPTENPNLFTDPSFESGHVGWIAFGGSLLEDVTDQAHTGTRCIKSTDRTQAFEGPSRRIEPLVVKGASYEVSGWVWGDGGPTISLTVKQVCQGAEDSYAPIASASEAATWTQLTGVFSVPDCVLTEFRLYFGGPDAGVDFYLDDVSLRLLE